MAKDIFVFSEFPANNLKVNVKVRFTRLFHLRMWAGTQLIRLVAWLWNSDVEFTVSEIE